MASSRYDFYIKPEDIKPEEKVELTKNEKIKNNIYYYKWHAIAIVGLLIFLVFMIYDLVSVEKPDYTISIISEGTLPDEVLTSLKTTIHPFAKDLNEDGEVIVSVLQYTEAVDNENADPNVVMANMVRLTGDITSGDTVMFIMQDSEIFQEKYGVLTYMDDFYNSPEDKSMEVEKMVIPFSDLSIYNSLGEIDVYGTKVDLKKVLQNYSIGLRIINETSLSENEDFIEYYNENIELFEAIR